MNDSSLSVDGAADLTLPVALLPSVAGAQNVMDAMITLKKIENTDDCLIFILEEKQKKSPGDIKTDLNYAASKYKAEDLARTSRRDIDASHFVNICGHPNFRAL